MDWSEQTGCRRGAHLGLYPAGGFDCAILCRDRDRRKALYTLRGAQSDPRADQRCGLIAMEIQGAWPTHPDPRMPRLGPWHFRDFLAHTIAAPFEGRLCELERKGWYSLLRLRQRTGNS